MKKTIKRMLLVFSILTSVSAGLSPIVIMNTKAEIAFQYLIGLSLIIGTTFLLLIIYLALDERPIVKLASLPITFILVMIGFMMKEMRLDLIFKGIIGLEISNDLLIPSSEGVFNLMRVMNLGLIITFIPMIIAAIVLLRQVTQSKRVDFSMYDDTRGKILKIEDTWTKINRLKVYKIEIEIPYYAGDRYVIEKNFSIPMHMIHLLTVGDTIELKVNPKKRKDVYINTHQGIL